MTSNSGNSKSDWGLQASVAQRNTPGKPGTGLSALLRLKS